MSPDDALTADRVAPAAPPEAPPEAPLERPSGRTLRDRWRAFRNARLADPRFQRWAARNPLTRRPASKDARALFDLTAGFVYSQILAACVRLRLFEALADGPRETGAVAGRIGLAPDAAERLLRAAAALRLVERFDSGGWGLGPLGAAFLGAKGVAEMVEHHATLYADLADPVALLKRRGGEVGAFWAYSRNDEAGALPPERVAAYSALMVASQASFLEDVVETFPLTPRRLIDVGGGEGRFAEAIAKARPGLTAGVFDLPGVAALAERRFRRAGVAAEAHGGDFFRDPVPPADCYTLIRVCFDHDDGPLRALLRRLREATPSDGALVVAETMAGTRGAEPVGDAYFGFYLLAMGSGRPRTAAELTALLCEAGYARVEEARVARPMLARMLVARP